MCQIAVSPEARQSQRRTNARRTCRSVSGLPAATVTKPARCIAICRRARPVVFLGPLPVATVPVVERQVAIASAASEPGNLMPCIMLFRCATLTIADGQLAEACCVQSGVSRFAKVWLKSECRLCPVAQAIVTEPYMHLRSSCNVALWSRPLEFGEVPNWPKWSFGKFIIRHISLEKPHRVIAPPCTICRVATVCGKCTQPWPSCATPRARTCRRSWPSMRLRSRPSTA